MCGLLKIRELIRNNRGSATVEISLVMPIVLGITVMIIALFVESVNDGVIHGEVYTSLYTYDDTVYSDAFENKIRDGISGRLYGRPEAFDVEAIRTRNSIGVNIDGVYRKTECGICTERLRRWQLYGDVFWE